MHHRKIGRRSFLATVFVAALITSGAAFAQTPAPDPLPSWNDGTAKQTITEFVRATSGMPPEQRIAVFDNDGTLWVEQPLYTQIKFAIDRVKALASASEMEDGRAVQIDSLGRPRSDGEVHPAGLRESGCRDP